MKELLMMIVHSLVDNPDQVDLKCVEGEKTLVFELRVHPDDVGKVIGKKGRTINAIRSVMKAIVTRNGKKVMLEILQ